ncbi:MAG TPA: M1 family aminopeptidase, partial [Gammaproteobacteria bacterium]|nr:M1 family aminopeptidase [Gammaproteobacteria bacterium]
MKQNKKPTIKYRKDYKVPSHLIDTTDLYFDLNEDVTIVTNHMHIRKNPASSESGDILVLDGKEQKLVSIKIDNQTILDRRYELTDETLTIVDFPESGELEITTEIKPQDNTVLMGLYKSSGIYCTQCESEGFRRITYFLDRPDVLSKFTTTIAADKKSYPILLSNGNLVDSGDSSGGRHWIKWEDPFLKPCYLFAAVAGDLEFIEDHFVTCSDRKITLRLFCEKGNRDKCFHAMDVLKQAMRWDEEKYGREYDLDLFMILAVDDFNVGAMENKGLNIFNSSCVFARSDTATDAEYGRIAGVVAHEYFHNWSGDRVTCRDWFQLSLKEGLTVFRDQTFSEDMKI